MLKHNISITTYMFNKENVSKKKNFCCRYNLLHMHHVNDAYWTIFFSSKIAHFIEFLKIIHKVALIMLKMLCFIMYDCRQPINLKHKIVGFFYYDMLNIEQSNAKTTFFFICCNSKNEIINGVYLRGDGRDLQALIVNIDIHSFIFIAH